MTTIQKLQWSIVDIINECLENWSNPNYNITLEATKHSTYSIVIIRLRHKDSEHNFFKSGIKITAERSEDVHILKSYLDFLEEL